MTRFSTMTVAAMSEIRDVLVAAGHSAQATAPSRKQADTTASLDEVIEASRAAKVDVFIESATSTPNRIPANPKLAAIADQLAESILATLEAHGYAVVRAADTSYVDEQRHEDFARECGRNAMAVVAMSEVA